MPAQLAGVGFDGEQRDRVQRIAAAARCRAPRRRLARREVHELQLRVVARGVPGRGAERRPAFVLGPGLEAGLAFARRGVERPEPRAVRGVVRLELAARREVAARVADEHLAVGDQRRVRVAFAGLVVAGPHFPELRSRARVERDEKAVGRRKIDDVAVHTHAAMARIRFRRCDVLRIGAHVLPDELARDGIEREHAAAALGDVYEPVRDDRRRDPAAVVAHRVRPDGAQPLDRAAVDLAQRAIGLDVVSAPIAEPIAGLGCAQALGGDRLPVAARRLCLRGGRQNYSQGASHSARGKRHRQSRAAVRAPMVFWLGAQSQSLIQPELGS